MKPLLRVFVFVFISLLAAQYVTNSFYYGLTSPSAFWLVWVSISVLYLLARPILKLVMLPTEGLVYVFLIFLLTSALLYVLPLFLSGFSIRPTSLSGLNIFGFMLPSKSLTSFWAGVFSAFIVSSVYTFLQSLCSKK